MSSPQVQKITPPPPFTNKHGFVRCMTIEAQKAFYLSLAGLRWWQSAKAGQQAPSWSTVFENTQWRCVYCKSDLTMSADMLAGSTKEHIVPRALLETNGVDPNTEENMAACCPQCNGLKGDYIPPATESEIWQSRDLYIAACYRFICKRRLDNLQEYLPDLVNVLAKNAGYPKGMFTGSVSQKP